MLRMISIFLIAAMVLCGLGCDDDFDLEDQLDKSITRIHTERTYFKDEHGRYLFIHGVNVSGSSKFPAGYNPVTYVGKPFPLDQADWNFRMLRDLGFNAIRLVMTWEAIEPVVPGDYDEDYLDYIEQIVAKANEYGIYCLMDMHEDFFSRHLFKLFDDQSALNSLEDPEMRSRGAPFGLNNVVQGDGAPEWVIKLCLPEKDVGGPQWGLPEQLVDDYRKTSDVIDFTLWGVNIFVSVDVNRSFATFFAGRDIYPNYEVAGQNIQDFLQDHFAGAWQQVVRRVAKYPNVIGYDIINEPGGLYIAFTIYALLWREAEFSPSGDLTPELIDRVLERYLESLWRQGWTLEAIDTLRSLLIDYDLLPQSVQQIRQAGFDPMDAKTQFRPNLGAALGLNANFNRNYLQPFHEKVGMAIQEEDPEAVIWLELSLGLPDTGIAGFMASPMIRPEGLKQIVYAPHYYTDIYPMFGSNQPPREFTVEEKRFRDYTEGIEGAIDPSTYALGNPPTVMGEFGTYYNFGGIEQSIAQDYAVSSAILDVYFETYERMLLHHMLWCYSPENTKANGEKWNKEDFSLLGPDQKPRSYTAYSRVYPRFTSGRIKHFHYNSPHHYYDPRPGQPDPYLEFVLEMEAKETDAPTEIFVPPLLFTEGFYVYLSDGQCAFDNETHTLYWFPSRDAPDAVHTIRIRPPYDDYGDNDWTYYINGEQMMEGGQ